jgi:hypothetical protein
MRLTFSEKELAIFAKHETNEDAIKNLMFDLSRGNEIVDSEGKVVSKAEANDKLRAFTLDFVGLEKGFSQRDLKRAFQSGQIRRYFDLIEEIVDDSLDVGYHESEWFNRLVDYRNIANGDGVEFKVEDDNVILSIATVGKSHHDYILQRPALGTTYTLPMGRYGAAVGLDINRYLAGQEDFAKLIAMLTKSIMVKNQGIIYGAIANAVSSLRVTTGFVDSGQLNASTKDDFDEIIDNVRSIYGDAVIIGTKTALRKITGLANVQWASDAQKAEIAGMGRLGSYEGTAMIEVEQRFADKTLDVNKKLMDDSKLYILPSDDYKIVEFVTRGETEIDEITEKGEEHGRIDDIGKYEVQYEQGIAVKANRQFGVWTILP